MTTMLFKQDARGQMRVWSIHHEDDTIYMQHGILGGVTQTKTERVARGLAGRTQQQQIASRIQSRINKQKDKGYIEDYEHAKAHRPTNTLGLPLPMLAQRYDRVPSPLVAYVQRKYDGNRCLVTKQEGEVVAYSRLGKPIKSIPHILEAARAIPEGTVLDGELYLHGTSLQTIRSWISRKQDDSLKLEFICYDQVSTVSYHERLQGLESFGLDHPIRLAESELLSGAEASPVGLSDRMRRTLADGYEGLILRHPDGKYETGKRSKHLIKLKPGMLDKIPMEEEEFLVLDIDKSKDGWAILVCGCTHGTFRVSAPGTMEEKYKVMNNHIAYLGSRVTVQFSNYTPDGKPFHPVAIAFRGVYD